MCIISITTVLVYPIYKEHTCNSKLVKLNNSNVYCYNVNKVNIQLNNVMKCYDRTFKT